MGREAEVLLGRLAGQRGHVLGILEGLTEEQLRRPVLPSGWNCLALVRHLTLSDERYWFRCVVGGEPRDILPAEKGGDWRVGADESGEDVFALYREEIRRADAVLAATDLDAPPKQPDPVWARWGMDFPDVRSVVAHVLVETSVHAGHLDAVRELLDGRQWVVQ
ncbi:DinB family protein [Streptomyces sp. HPF1205]|uniref:DinB family protein n=1 Tax=Streptomyces sp. HPF1205 TaxID=2873262 RepID=UPI001CED9C43|nr:DinB family protein [Streptomyces sp. HPF1205]